MSEKKSELGCLSKRSLWNVIYSSVQLNQSMVWKALHIITLQKKILHKIKIKKIHYGLIVLLMDY
jgi:hypothetical protein